MIELSDRYPDEFDDEDVSEMTNSFDGMQQAILYIKEPTRAATASAFAAARAAVDAAAANAVAAKAAAAADAAAAAADATAATGPRPKRNRKKRDFLQDEQAKYAKKKPKSGGGN